MMLKKKWVLLIGCYILFSGLLVAGNGWQLSAGAGLTSPLGPLSDWFRSGSQFHLALGRDLEGGWFAEGLVEYARYDRENLSGYADGKLDLYLEHIAFWASGNYELLRWNNVSGYLAIAGGPLYWKGIRGEIAADEDLAIPFIAEKVLEEWNMGFRTGLGSRIAFGPIGTNILLNYRFVVGNLWPTMQENIELDGVNGFHSLNLDIRLFYSL